MECKHVWEEQREGNVFFCKKCGVTQYFLPEEETLYETPFDGTVKKETLWESILRRYPLDECMSMKKFLQGEK